MYAGLISVAVRVGENPEKITLYAESDTLERASITVDVGSSADELEHSKASSAKIEVLIAGN